MKIEQLTDDDDLRAMIDDDLVRAPPRARAVARPSRDARHGAEPGRLLPGARDGQPVLRWPARPSCRRRWTSSPRSPAASTTCSTTSARPDAERVIVLMGSGAEAAQETVDYLNARGREGRRAEGAPVPAVLGGAFRRGAAGHRQDDRRARPHQGAGRAGEPLYQDVVTALSEASRPAATQVRPPRHRRPLRPVVEGIHARDGQGRLRRAGKAPAEEPLHRRHQRRRHAHQPGLRPGLLHRRPEDVPRHVLRPGRGRHGGRQQELDQDHRRGHRQLRPGLLRLRLEEVRLDDHLAPALRPAADPLALPDQPGQLSWPATSSISWSATTC